MIYNSTPVSNPEDIPDEWDFYPCRVDDAPASISLNMWYANHASPPGSDTLYWVRLDMVGPGDHGMGDPAEAHATYPIVDGLADHVRGLGAHYVGQLRNRGVWQVAFYGPPGHSEALGALCREIEADTGRQIQTGHRRDPEWDHFRTLLAPDAERRRWMQDRRVVEALREHGDPLTQRRRVDHWSYFASAAARNAYITAARVEGFAVQDTVDRSEHSGRAYGAQLQRIDSVQLEDIHAAVMTLHALTEAHGGVYDGWETSVEQP